MEEILSTQDIPQDTKSIQLRSVIEFMRQLDYDFYVSSFIKRGSDDYHGPADIVSFGTAVAMHNNIWIKSDREESHYIPMLPLWWYGDADLPCPFITDAYTLEKAQSACIVYQAHLQYSRRKGVMCHKHWVHFKSPAYAKLFLEKE